MNKENKNAVNLEYFKITSVSREDILQCYENEDGFEEIKRRIEKIPDVDMEWIARKLAEDFCSCCFWDSLKIRSEHVMSKNAEGEK